MKEIMSFEDFTEVLHGAGFTMGGGNSEGIFSIVPWNWNEPPPYSTPVRWHTEDPETDPCEWRMRVLNERDDIAYAKLFFNKSGYITREWYPYFLAARRKGKSFYEAYEDGKISHAAKRVYEIVEMTDAAPLHAIKQDAGFGKEEKSAFDRAVTELQMKMFITMCGSSRKRSAKGEEYSWPSTMFCTTELFWGEELFAAAGKIVPDEAVEKITGQVFRLNPDAQSKKIAKFIKG